MSQNTAHMRSIIDAAKAGSGGALDLLRLIITQVASKEPKELPVPDEVIIDVSEVILRHGIEQGRRDAEQN